MKCNINEKCFKDGSQSRDCDTLRKVGFQTCMYSYSFLVKLGTYFLAWAFMFGMWYHLEDLYQDYSNYTPGAKNGPALGVTCFK